MGTSYYKLQEPITRIHIENHLPPLDHLVQLLLWVEGKEACAGELTLTEEQAHTLVDCLLNRDDTPAFHSHWGGKLGTVVQEYEGQEGPWPGDMTVVSEYRDIMTADQVRARQGAKREDGMPTELFGFEDGVRK